MLHPLAARIAASATVPAAVVLQLSASLLEGDGDSRETPRVLSTQAPRVIEPHKRCRAGGVEGCPGCEELAELAGDAAGRLQEARTATAPLVRTSFGWMRAW